MGKRRKGNSRNVKIVYRSAVTGRFVSEDFARQHPHTTVGHSLSRRSVNPYKRRKGDVLSRSDFNNLFRVLPILGVEIDRLTPYLSEILDTTRGGAPKFVEITPAQIAETLNKTRGGGPKRVGITAAQIAAIFNKTRGGGPKRAERIAEEIAKQILDANDSEQKKEEQ